jgi:hypothetical protein
VLRQVHSWKKLAYTKGSLISGRFGATMGGAEVPVKNKLSLDKYIRLTFGWISL